MYEKAWEYDYKELEAGRKGTRKLNNFFINSEVGKVGLNGKKSLEWTLPCRDSVMYFSIKVWIHLSELKKSSNQSGRGF